MIFRRLFLTLFPCTLLYWYAHSNQRGLAPATASSNTLPHAVHVEPSPYTAINPLRERTQDAAIATGSWIYPKSLLTEEPQNRSQGPDKMSVWPPVSGDPIVVRFNRPARGYLRLIDASGKVWYQEFINRRSEMEIDLAESLKTGAYRVELTGLDGLFLQSRFNISKHQ
jgi:hypothetical protein